MKHEPDYSMSDRSFCCNQSLRVEGGDEGTRWYVCTGCGQPSDSVCSHLMPVGARTLGDELISWKCTRCGEWIRE